MKRAAIILSVVVLAVVALSWALPLLFKDKILQAVDMAIQEQVRADVTYDKSLFDMGLFRHFPHPTVGIGDILVTNRAPFYGDTLVSIGRLGFTLDLFSLFGSRTRIKSVEVNKIDLRIHILEDGTANYDILIEQDSAGQGVAQPETTYSVGIDSWRIADGRVSYEDATMPMVCILEGVHHRGSGDFTQDVVDLRSQTQSERVTLRYDGISWLSGQAVDADMDMTMQLDSGIYRFADNLLRINDLPLYFDGSIRYDEAYMSFDLDFAAKDADIKSLYSLIPAAYTDSYRDVQAEGDLSVRGSLKGRYDEQTLPDVVLDIVAENGQLRYPDVSQPLSNIEINAHIASRDGDYSQVEIDVPKFNVNIGANPVRAAFHIRNLVDYDMVASIEARVDLADLSAVFPMEGYTTRGILDLFVQAQGRYDSTKNLMPDVDARIALRDGFVRSDTLPGMLEQVHFNARFQSPGGSLKQAALTVDDMGFRLGEDNIAMNLAVEDFTDYRWDAEVKGSLDLGMLSDYLDLEGTAFSGRMQADMRSSGRYSDVERGDYAGVRATGTLSVRQFGYTSTDMPFGIAIETGRASLTPQSLQIEDVAGNIGKSDILLEGSLNGYLEYFLGEAVALQGNVNLQSEVLDLNQWITGRETPEEGYAEDEAELESYVLPEQVDIWLTADAQKVYYDNLVLRSARGRLHLHDRKLDLEGFSFEVLDGQVSMTGYYDTRTEDSVRFAYMLDVEALSIPEAFTKFESVQRFAPMASQAVGRFSSDFSLSGILGPQLKPLYPTLDGSGTIRIGDAGVKESRLVDQLASLTGYGFSTTDIRLDDVSIQASLQRGRSYVKPFRVSLGGHDAMISGSIGVDGSLDYTIDADFDAGKLGVQFNTLVAGITGKEDVSGVVPVHFMVRGTYDNPKLVLAGADTGAQALAEEAVERISDEGRKGIENLLSGDTAALEKQVDSLRKSVEDIESAGEGVKSILNNLFGNKKKEKKE